VAPKTLFYNLSPASGQESYGTKGTTSSYCVDFKTIVLPGITYGQSNYL
jgi:hypothetical protein